MKKIIIALLVLISLPLAVLAKNEIVTFDMNPLTHTDAKTFVENLGNWLFTFALVAVPIVILVGAFMFVTAAGNPEKIKTGRQLILWAIVGLFIILGAKGIILIVSNIIKP